MMKESEGDSFFARIILLPSLFENCISRLSRGHLLPRVHDKLERITHGSVERASSSLAEKSKWARGSTAHQLLYKAGFKRI